MLCRCSPASTKPLLTELRLAYVYYRLQTFIKESKLGNIPDVYILPKSTKACFQHAQEYNASPIICISNLQNSKTRHYCIQDKDGDDDSAVLGTRSRTKHRLILGQLNDNMYRRRGRKLRPCASRVLRLKLRIRPELWRERGLCRAVRPLDCGPPGSGNCPQKGSIPRWQ